MRGGGNEINAKMVINEFAATALDGATVVPNERWPGLGVWGRVGTSLTSSTGNNKIKLDISIATYSATTTFRGPVYANNMDGSALPDTFECVIAGWRALNPIDFNATRPRIIIGTATDTVNHKVLLSDLSNGLESEVVGKVRTDVWSRVVDVSPISGPIPGPTPGPSFNSTLVVPAGFEILQCRAQVTTAFGTGSGLTTFSVGWSGANAGVIASLGDALNSTALLSTPLASTTSARTISVTPNAGTFDGTGTVRLFIKLRLIGAY
jgi:hypothetical protein